LGLAAFAEENFGRAHRLFLDSAGSNEKRMREAERRFGEYREATARDYRLAGDAAYNNYAFDRALDAYAGAWAISIRNSTHANGPS